MKKNKKKIIIGIIAFFSTILIGIIAYFLYINIYGESKYLKIKLNGKKEITLNYKDEYKDQGATASYKNKNLTKNIKVKKNINYKKIGTYSYTYTIKYKKQKKSIKRIIKIVDKEEPVITLNGDSTLNIYLGSNYEEKGYTATDNYDGDLTEKVETIGSVDINKLGEYIITYQVSDSSNNTIKAERKVNVIEKPKPVQKVAVLNYHFFYESPDEGCNETICESMTKFRQHLKWLNDNGYKTLTMKEFVSWMYGEISVPEKSVLITIDDGAHGTGKHNGNHLIPALEEYKIHATLFLITGWWDISNYSSPYLEVESHTNDLHHEANCGNRSKVNCVSYDELLADLKKSIEITKSSTAFCFPYYEATTRSVQAVKDAGFKVAFIGGNKKASRNDDKYHIPRYVIYDSTSLQEFINKVS